jgi:hypothetical protein
LTQTDPFGALDRVEYGAGESGATCLLHHLRHSFCTKLAESGAANSVMLDMMGHVGPATLKHHSHIREEARGSDFRPGKAAFRRIARQRFPQSEQVRNAGVVRFSLMGG